MIYDDRAKNPVLRGGEDFCPHCDERVKWGRVQNRTQTLDVHRNGSCACGHSVWLNECKEGKWGYYDFLGSEKSTYAEEKQAAVLMLFNAGGRWAEAEEIAKVIDLDVNEIEGIISAFVNM